MERIKWLLAELWSLVYQRFIVSVPVWTLSLGFVSNCTFHGASFLVSCILQIYSVHVQTNRFSSFLELQTLYYLIKPISSSGVLQ